MHTRDFWQAICENIFEFEELSFASDSRLRGQRKRRSRSGVVPMVEAGVSVLASPFSLFRLYADSVNTT
jgi:hypothetical protein